MDCCGLLWTAVTAVDYCGLLWVVDCGLMLCGLWTNVDCCGLMHQSIPDVPIPPPPPGLAPGH